MVPPHAAFAPRAVRGTIVERLEMSLDLLRGVQPRRRHRARFVADGTPLRIRLWPLGALPDVVFPRVRVQALHGGAAPGTVPLIVRWEIAGQFPAEVVVLGPVHRGAVGQVETAFVAANGVACGLRVVSAARRVRALAALVGQDGLAPANLAKWAGLEVFYTFLAVAAAVQVVVEHVLPVEKVYLPAATVGAIGEQHHLDLLLLFRRRFLPGSAPLGVVGSLDEHLQVLGVLLGNVQEDLVTVHVHQRPVNVDVVAGRGREGDTEGALQDLVLVLDVPLEPVGVHEAEPSVAVDVGALPNPVQQLST